MKTTCAVSLVLLLISITRPAPSQQIPVRMPGMEEQSAFQKLYLHTDRNYYFLGDTIWFKAYFVDGKSHRLLLGEHNLHAELVDKEGDQIRKLLIYMRNGTAPGRMVIPDSLEPGQYLLRAYTDIQKERGEEHFFHKGLEVSKVRSTLDREEQPPRSGLDPQIDLAFLPEGGFLLEGIMNTAGIKVIDGHGRSMSVSGEILDDEGRRVSTFETSCHGMDTVRLRPLAGHEYQIRLAGHPAFRKKINGIHKTGCKVEFQEAGNEQLHFRVVANAAAEIGKTYHFAIMHRGTVIFYKEFIMKGPEFPIRISRGALPAGINRLVLMDERLIPVSERLFFSGNMEINEIRIEPDSETYSTRSPVILHLSQMEDLGPMAWSSLSLSVIASNAAENQAGSSNILSWLLINSELKGYIHSPGDFFRDDPEFSSAHKLDLLMLTQGWSNYLWNNARRGNEGTGIGEVAGITLNGSVRNALTKRPVAGGLVVGNLYHPSGHLAVETETDSRGRFSLPGLFFPDSAALFLQGYNRKGKLYTEVFLDSLDLSGPAVPEAFLPVSRRLEEFPVRLYQQQFYNEQELREYSLRTGSILLDEVTVKSRFTTVSDGHFRLYAKPKDSFKITEKDYQYRTVFDYLQAHVGGFSSPTISFAGGSSAQLLLLDGSEIEFDMMSTIPMSDVDVIEFVKNYDVAGTSIFGARGANGIISVFTKKGGADLGYEHFLQGTLTRYLDGFYTYREFYSPAYTPENIDAERPDHRITLYWNPEIELNDTGSMVSFFTSDDFSRYHVVVEGISSTGEVCLGKGEIRVSSAHSGSLNR